MNNIYSVPSFYAHLFNGLFLMVAIIVLFVNYKNISKLETHKYIILVLLFSIGFGVHSISHIGLEKVYGYNPLSAI